MAVSNRCCSSLYPPPPSNARFKATYVLQHFDVVDVGGEAQRQPRQEGVVAGVQEARFQQDVLSGAEGKVGLLAGKRGRKMRKEESATCKQQATVQFEDLKLL